MAEKKPRKSQSSASDLQACAADAGGAVRVARAVAGVERSAAMARRPAGRRPAAGARLGAVGQPADPCTAQLKQLADSVAAAPVQTALRRRRYRGCGRWRSAKAGKAPAQAQILPADLEAAYAAPAEFGFSKLALLEAALSEDKPVARVVREGKAKSAGPGRAAPAMESPTWSCRLPLTAADRQSSIRPRFRRRPMWRCGRAATPCNETGQPSLADGAESLARPIGKTGLRVVAATPDGIGRPDGPGRDFQPGGGGVMRIAGRTGAAGRARRAEFGSGRQARRCTRTTANPRWARPWNASPCRARRLAQATADEDTNAVTISTGNAHVEVDPGIFRAYDIRGVVGSDAERGGGRTHRPGHRLGDGGAGPGRHRGGPRRPPVRSRTFARA